RASVRLELGRDGHGEAHPGGDPPRELALVPAALAHTIGEVAPLRQPKLFDRPPGDGERAPGRRVPKRSWTLVPARERGVRESPLRRGVRVEHGVAARKEPGLAVGSVEARIRLESGT